MGVERIIDAHHHLWDLKEVRHTWLAEKGVRFFGDPEPIQTNYHVPDFREDIGELPVVASVHVQCGVALEDSIRETEWVSEQADEYCMVAAIVAFCDLTGERREAELDAQQAFGRLRGIRQIVGRDAVEDARNGTNALLESPEFLAGLRSLLGRQLSFDLQLTPPLLTTAAKLFGKVEALPVALCHAGSPQDLSSEGIRDWETGLHRFAELPNAVCKLSGFGMFDHGWTVDSVRERVLRAIDAFGPTRCMFGSNFPVDKLTGSYGQWMGAYLSITEGFTDAERAAMFSDTAEGFYRMAG